MKKWQVQMVFVCLAVVALCSVSCEKYALPRLECNIDTIWSPVEGGMYDVVVSSNVTWSFNSESIQDWIYIDTKFGEPQYTDTDYPVKVRVSQNEDASDRECVMEITSMTLNRKLVVKQKGTGIEPEPESDAETDPETGGQ